GEREPSSTTAAGVLCRRQEGTPSTGVAFPGVAEEERRGAAHLQRGRAAASGVTFPTCNRGGAAAAARGGASPRQARTRAASAAAAAHSDCTDTTEAERINPAAHYGKISSARGHTGPGNP
ncbi:hypothetical protein Taro_013277, partial [Colocasia esculenta]|nr:hypothetical protein [Colocasia esculenta]